MLIWKVGKTICSLLTLQQLATSLSALADGESSQDKILAKSGDLLVYTLNQYSDTVNIKWVKGDFRSLSSGGNAFSVKAFSGIKEDKRQVVFSQYGLSKDQDGSTLNVGLGFHNFIPKASEYQFPADIVLGANIFYDTKTGTMNISNPFGEGVHKRYSVGGTIMTAQTSAFFNIYQGISDGIENYKASNGYDYGLNSLISGLESINLGVTKYKYSEENKGSIIKFEYKPNSLFTFGAESNNAEGIGSEENSLFIKTTYKFNTPFEDQLKPIKISASNVWDKRYGEVKREGKLVLDLEREEIPSSVFLEEVIDDGKETSPATMGTKNCPVSLDTTNSSGQGRDISAFNVLFIESLQSPYNANGQTVTVSGSSLTFNEDGELWTSSQLFSELAITTENCFAMTYGDKKIALFVRKGTSCFIDVTFEANDEYRAKIETVRFYAD